MVRKRFLNSLVAAALFLFLVSWAVPAAASAVLVNNQAGAVIPDYSWWKGCSPTSAGMMMGYYDIYGYNGLSYNNLVQGGVAEGSTYGSGPYLANNAIASSGHITDFYAGGTGASWDDLPSPWHAFNSLADFMGTSQDANFHTNGMTSFGYHTDGSRMYDYQMSASPNAGSSGMLGMWEYFSYAGYGSATPSGNFYNQQTDNLGLQYGFSFLDYQAEIDAGRVVLIHVEGHSMFGYGYDTVTGEIILHDTWTEGEHRMTWGGSYSGLPLFAVTCFTPTGGDAVPLPGAVWLLGSGLLALVGFRKKSQN